MEKEFVAKNLKSGRRVNFVGTEFGGGKARASKNSFPQPSSFLPERLDFRIQRSDFVQKAPPRGGQEWQVQT